MPSRRLVVACLLALAVGLAVVSPAAAQTTSSTTRPGRNTTSSTERRESTTTTDPDDEETPETAPRNRPRPDEVPRSEIPITDDPRVAPELAYLIVDGSEYTRAVAAFHEGEDLLEAAEDEIHKAEDGITDAQDHIDRATEDYNGALDQLAELLEAIPRLEGQINQATRRVEKSERRIAEVRVHLRSMAVDQYVRGGLGGAAEETLSVSRANEASSRQILVGTVQRDRLIELHTNLTVVHEQRDLIARSEAELKEVRQRIATAEGRRDAFAAERQQAETDRADAVQRRDDRVADRDRVAEDLQKRKKGIADARLTADVPGLDFPFVVLNAYVRAASFKAREDPSCGITWTALAGIGKTESNHGTYDGADVDGDGNITKPIYGIPLDGSNGTASIGDTDGGEIDDFPEGDRAAGPMQFIPSSWKHYGRDANRDGKIDPQNLNDAAMAAAGLLCDRTSTSLATDAGLRQAFFRYNPDQRYVSVVLGRVHGYDDFVIPWPADVPEPLPVGELPPPPGQAAPTTESTTTTAPPLGR